MPNFRETPQNDSLSLETPEQEAVRLGTATPKETMPSLEEKASEDVRKLIDEQEAQAALDAKKTTEILARIKSTPATEDVPVGGPIVSSENLAASMPPVLDVASLVSDETRKTHAQKIGKIQSGLNQTHSRLDQSTRGISTNLEVVREDKVAAQKHYEDTINKEREEYAQKAQQEADEHNKKRTLWEKITGKNKVSVEDVVRDRAEFTQEHIQQNPAFLKAINSRPSDLSKEIDYRRAQAKGREPKG